MTREGGQTQGGCLSALPTTTRGAPPHSHSNPRGGGCLTCPHVSGRPCACLACQGSPTRGTRTSHLGSAVSLGGAPCLPRMPHMPNRWRGREGAGPAVPSAEQRTRPMPRQAHDPEAVGSTSSALPTPALAVPPAPPPPSGGALGEGHASAMHAPLPAGPGPMQWPTWACSARGRLQRCSA